MKRILVFTGGALVGAIGVAQGDAGEAAPGLNEAE